MTNDLSSQDWGKYKTSFYNQEDSVPGDFADFKTNGYQLVVPLNSTFAEYQKLLTNASGALFGAGARGVQMRMTVYHRTVDYCIKCILLFEYGIEN